MNSERNLDIFRDSHQSQTSVYRVAAETELHNPYFSPADRQRRHDEYMRQAQQLEQQP